MKICLWPQKDFRIKVIDGGENKDPGDARNILIDAARGEYIIFVDADDTISSFGVEKMAHCLEKHHADFVQIDNENETIDGKLN